MKNKDNIEAGFNRLFNDVKDAKTPKQKKTSTPANPASGNVYKAAWDKEYTNLPNWRQKEIDRFVQNKDHDNRHYSDFVQQVIETAERVIEPETATESKS